MSNAGQRISKQFVEEFDQKFTDEIALKYRKIHQENCHHWDFTFLLWHRKFVTEFWSEIGLPRTYAVFTEREDRNLYRDLTKTVLAGPDGDYIVRRDPNKLDSFTNADLEQLKLNIAQASVCNSFALDLDFEGANRLPGTHRFDFGYYNLSFSSQVEEFHDIVHGETGRGMRSVITAGGDQCFFVHHSFVDLVFETWLADNPDAVLPISQETFDNTPDLQQDYNSYNELVDIWGARYFSDEDYKFVRRITAPISRQVIVFDNIEHTEEYRRVIMYHGGSEIGRFAIVTGELDTCLTCARRGAHKGQFLLRELVPISEIIWNIDRQLYSWDAARSKFEELGMSQPRIESF